MVREDAWHHRLLAVTLLWCHVKVISVSVGRICSLPEKEIQDMKHKLNIKGMNVFENCQVLSFV